MDQWGELYRDRAEKAEAEVTRLRAGLAEMRRTAVYLAGALANPALKKAALDKLEKLLAHEQNAEGYHPLDKDPKPY